jgi:hypothetical protein
MNKILYKVLFIGFVIILLQLTVFVTESKAGFFDDIIKQGDSFTDSGKITIEKTEANSAAKYIFNTLFYIGMAASLIIGGVIGIKFMIASAEEKAKLKETMIPYILGCVVVFGAFTIWKIVVLALDGIA